MVTYIYAGLFGVMLVGLSLQVVFNRKRSQVALGDNNHVLLQRAIRAQGNFTEYVPLALLLLYMVETTYQNPLIAHGLGLSLLIGRVLHALGIARQPEPLIFRQVGMGLTFTALLVSSILLLIAALT
ncbi:MAPEG family protein [Pseudoalteromonas fenneropenaei]|uniref:MAPEG family protein n=1 Tax=Pseudoalteromonas fenneropenaei TaxID=1737459 RepID=A0ABV7CDM8_9GAMM